MEFDTAYRMQTIGMEVPGFYADDIACTNGVLEIELRQQQTLSAV